MTRLYLKTIFHVSIDLLAIIFFPYLQVLLKKLHNYEFYKNFRANWLIFGMVFLIELKWWAKKIVRLFVMPTWYKDYDEIDELVGLVNPYGMLIGVAVLFFKNTCDFLQDVSKLDYIETVSRFQFVLSQDQEYLTRLQKIKRAFRKVFCKQKLSVEYEDIDDEV